MITVVHVMCQNQTNSEELYFISRYFCVQLQILLQKVKLQINRPH